MYRKSFSQKCGGSDTPSFSKVSSRNRKILQSVQNQKSTKQTVAYLKKTRCLQTPERLHTIIWLYLKNIWGNNPALV